MRFTGTPRVALFSLLGVGALILSTSLLLGPSKQREHGLGMAVEYTNHAAVSYVAQDKGWYESRGLNTVSHTIHVTGMALASALARGDIQAAYMCLVPAINAYANAGVPIRIVAGTHKYGYALVVHPDVVESVEDLEEERVRLGCVREGGAVDLVMNRAIDKYGLDRRRILEKTRRMNPPRLLLALQAGQLDAAFLPEHWVAMAEDLGMELLLGAQDVWPGLQGSVLVVKEELLRADPDLVRELIAVNEQSTLWINEHPREAADILARVLSVAGESGLVAEISSLGSSPDIEPATMLRSMGRLEYTTAVSTEDVQELIDYAAELGYIDGSFPAEEIMETSLLP